MAAECLRAAAREAVTGEMTKDGAIGYALVARFFYQFDAVAKGLSRGGKR